MFHLSSNAECNHVQSFLATDFTINPWTLNVAIVGFLDLVGDLFDMYS